MCVQYWPPSKDKDESYGDIYLGIAKEEQLANFHIRTFHVYKKQFDVSITLHNVLLVLSICEIEKHVQTYFHLYYKTSCF